jgi:hypothetical protein
MGGKWNSYRWDYIWLLYIWACMGCSVQSQAAQHKSDTVVQQDLLPTTQGLAPSIRPVVMQFTPGQPAALVLSAFLMTF